MRRWREAARALDARELAQALETATWPLSRVFSSCRSSPPSSPRGPFAVDVDRHRISARQAVSPRIPAISLDATCSVSICHELSWIASSPSSPSSPLMRCPGSGLQRSRFVHGSSEPLRPSMRSTASRRVGIRAGSSEPEFAAAAVHLVNQPPWCSHLHPYKGER